MPRKKALSVVIPICNEEEKLPLALIAIDSHLADEKSDYEIIVPVYNSTDKTKEIIRRFQSLIKNLYWFEVENIQQAVSQAIERTKGRRYMFVNVNDIINFSDTIKRSSIRGIIDYLSNLCQNLKIQYYSKRCQKNTT